MNTTEPRLSAKDHVPALLAPWAAVRDELNERRKGRAARKQLERDLASYTSQSDLDDLHAALDRYDDSETAAVRAILRRRQVA